MMFPDGPHQMQLDSLFDPKTDWKNFIINTVITYVNTHMHVEGDCHNPAAFPILMRERFLITPEGIALYPEDFTESSRQLVVTIPWIEADAYLRTDIRTRLIPAQ